MRSWQILLLVIVMVSGLQSVHGQRSLGGLRAEIIAVTIPASRRPVVTFQVSDAKGKPIDLEELDPAGVYTR